MVIEDGVLDFLDGNLTPYEEEELLHRLAVSPERRALLKQHLHVRELTSTLARKNRYTVPKAVTASLFETLSANGYAGPIFQSSHESAEVLRTSLENNIDRSAAKIVAKRKSLYLTSAFSFVLGAVLMYFILPGLIPQTNVPSPSANTLSTNNNASTISSLLSTQKSQMTNSDMNAVSQGDAKAESYPSPFKSSNKYSAVSTGSQTTLEGVDDRGQQNTFALQEDIAIEPSMLTISSYTTNVALGTSEASLNKSTDNLPKSENSRWSNVASSTSVIDNSTLEKRTVDINRELASVSSKPWWENGGIRSGSISDIPSKGYFGRDRELEISNSILDRTTASVRTGGGTLPNANSVTASLIEFKISANLNDWIVGKLSFGQFMPYETEAQNAGKNADGVRQLELIPVLQSKSVVGAEIGVQVEIIGAPIELMGGIITDMKNGVIPRGSIFSHFELFESLDLGIGVEAVLYTNNVSSSLADKQNIFSYEHPVLISQPKSEELSGFIGPAIELLWHF